MHETPESHFEVHKPYQFRAHPELLAELLIHERIHEQLPKNREQYVSWLKRQLMAPERASLEEIQGLRAKPCQLTPRYLLLSVIEPGRTCTTSYMADGNLFSTPCDFLGLVDATQRKAATFCATQGMDYERALEMFRPRPPSKASTGRIWPDWAIGYDTGTANAIIIDANHKQSAERFLLGLAGGVYSPFQDTE